MKLVHSLAVLLPFGTPFSFLQVVTSSQEDILTFYVPRPTVSHQVILYPVQIVNTSISTYLSYKYKISNGKESVGSQVY